MATRRPVLSFRAVAALALALVLAACTKGGQFDPTEMLNTDLFNTKKKIVGDREPLFPEGVPGAETGVPPDLIKGYQPPPEPAAVAPNADAAAKTAAVAEKPKPKPKPKVATAPPPAAHDPAFDQKPVSPGPAQQPAQSWPAPQSQPAQAPWPAPGQAQSNWPAPPASTH